METTVKKLNISQLKSDIKKLAENQKFYRNQRKSVYIIGERKMTPSEAQFRHTVNSHELRLMYAAYGLMRGKTFNQVECHYSASEKHPLESYKLNIEKLIEKYSIIDEDNLVN